MAQYLQLDYISSDRMKKLCFEPQFVKNTFEDYQTLLGHPLNSHLVMTRDLERTPQELQ